jgi:hypothetical protein
MRAKTFVPLFIPAAFCAFISAMALFMGDSAKPAFYAFLPMCFFFAAMPLVTINKRIAYLEDKLNERTMETHSTPSGGDGK